MRAASRVSNASNVISAELDHNKGGKFTFDDGYLQRLGAATKKQRNTSRFISAVF